MKGIDDVTEVVWVKDRVRLIDAESYERGYATRDGRRLSSGYYVARWPSGTINPGFLNDQAEFQGPYRSRREAQANLAIRVAWAAVGQWRASPG